MYRYSQYHLILIMFIFISITTVGSLLLGYIFLDRSSDQQSIVIMTFIVIATILLVIDNGIICSRMMRDKNLSRQEVGRYLTNNIFFSICYLLLPFFVFYKGCQCRKIAENMNEDNSVNNVNKLENYKEEK